MKHILFVTLFAISGIFSNVHAQSLSDFESMFWQQIKNTCGASMQWEKSVQEIEEGTPGDKQVRKFEVNCLQGMAQDKANGEKLPLSRSEFDQLFAYSFENPYYAEYLDISREGKSMTAVVKSEQADDTDLRKQIFEVDDHTGVLRHAEIHVLKESALYDMELTISVDFDAQGRYLKHYTTTLTEVFLAGMVRSVIEGRRL